MKMRILHDEIVYDGKFIRMIKRHFIDRGGEKKLWEIIERKACKKGVAIAAITPENKIVLEKIFRVPMAGYILDLPAGLADKEGESEEELIRRELAEETGYIVDKADFLMRAPANAGLLKEEEFVLYLGSNARKVQKPQLEDSEDIEVLEAPLNQLADFVRNLKDARLDVKVVAAIPFLLERGYSVQWTKAL